MRNLALLILFLFCYATVFAEKIFLIKGKFSGIKQNIITVYLIYVKNGISFKDSTRPHNNIYSFRGLIDEPTLFTLAVKFTTDINLNSNPENLQYEGFQIFSEPTVIQIESRNRIANIKTTGSILNPQYQSYLNKIVIPNNMKLAALQKSFQESVSTMDTLLRNRIELEIRQQNKTIIRNKIQYIKDNPECYFVVYIIEEIFIENENVEDAIFLFSKISKKIKQTNYSKELQKTLSSQKYTCIGCKFPESVFIRENIPKLNLKKMQGKIILIDIWASWCLPCRAQFPELKLLYNEHKGDGFEIIGISLDTDINRMKTVIISDSIEWANFCETMGWESLLAKTFNFKAIPYNILLSKDGTIIGKNISIQDLEEVLKTQL